MYMAGDNELQQSFFKSGTVELGIYVKVVTRGCSNQIYSRGNSFSFRNYYKIETFGIMICNKPT